MSTMERPRHAETQESATPSPYADHLDRTQGAKSLDRFFAGFDVWYGSTLPESKDAKILDFGCGRGDFIRWLSSRGYSEVDGLDIIGDYRESIEVDTGATIHIVEDGILYLAAHPDEYDRIFLLDVLEHVPPPVARSMAAAARTALRPGGELVVTGPHAASIGGLYTRYEDFTHHNCFTVSSLEFLFGEANFKTVENVAPVIPWSWRPKSLAYRAARSMWFATLKLIYKLERPGEAAPPHFFPRLVMRAR